MSAQEYPYNRVDVSLGSQALAPEVARLSNTRTPSTFLLFKASMVRLKYDEARQSELVETKAELARLHELYLKIR